METKPGYKTTEFWLTVVVFALSFLATSGLFSDSSQTAKIVGVILDTLAAMGYSSSRGIAKSGQK